MAEEETKTPAPQGGTWATGELQSILRERRSAVLSRLDVQQRTPVLAELVFDLLVHLALNPDTALDESIVESFAWRHEIELTEVSVPLLDGSRALLTDVLLDQNVPSTVEVVNALLALGFASKLKPLEETDKQSFSARIVGLLPGVERVGPYVITDYIDLVCSEADAQKFWSIYCERIALEINKRGAYEADDNSPWLLQHLLGFHQHGAAEVRGRAWTTLRRHIKRILRIDRDRSRFVRGFIDTVSDLAALHYLCSSPTMVEDRDLIQQLLTRGEEKQISCALFALQVHGELDGLVGRALEHFRSRPLPEIAHRVTEIYAQLNLASQPSANLRNLRAGLLKVMLDKVAEGGSVESLAQAIANDARALRHGLLIADLGRDTAFRKSPHGQRLLDRAVTIFFQSFTPSAVDHPFNDALFSSAMVRVLRVMLEEGAGRIKDRLESFGVELSDHVERWTGEGVPIQIRNKLLARFAVIFARTVVAVARTLCSEPKTIDAGRTLYRTLVRVYLEHYEALEGDPSFGAIEFALRPLFPEMIGQSIEHIDVGEIIDASHVMARLEYAFGTFEDDEILDQQDEVRALGNSSLLLRKPDREKPLIAPVEVLERRHTVYGSVLRAYFGVEFLTYLKDRLLRVLGVRRDGELMLTDRELVVSSKRVMGGRVFERTGDSHSLDDLLAVKVRRRLRYFYFATGLLGLIAAGVIGGHLLFVGLRGADTTLALVGGGLIGLGILFDAAMSRVSERSENTVVLELSFKSQPQRFNLAIDTTQGSEILDAFMAGDAERRELELIEQWVQRDVDWEPLDGPIKLET